MIVLHAFLSYSFYSCKKKILDKNLLGYYFNLLHVKILLLKLKSS
ncbi:conserved hypothetical protein [Xenorhabdus nematophila F1]|uniref:Uncharacterized protein n=1 Tax=Xenorhabdus nematophila (strain ATCC 19061 / DSM 3370 / CCUG 14189 / LMG 1036 / NCIMB 9965 / AN6) TaxID=406817 RepID=D3VFK1_XENNA|nr:hypothetical protein XNC1_2256 [Xenorhabdus nematophila ATCC 19061]CCW32325.1 conserved hypothetical protein [Xenorhabdus nematophila F1]